MTGQELRRRRERLGLSQAEVAAAFGVDANTWSRWERDAQAIRYPRVLRFALDRLAEDRARFGADEAAWKAHVAAWFERDWAPAP